MGTLILAAPASTSKGNPIFTVLIFGVLIVLFYMLIMRPQRNRQRRAMQTQSHVGPGQRIRTTAGMYGTVVSGDDRDVVIEIAPGVEVTMLRRAIMDVVPDDDEVSSADTPADTEASADAQAEAGDEPEQNDAEPAAADGVNVDVKDRNS